jgi:hypothetical protein
VYPPAVRIPGPLALFLLAALPAPGCRREAPPAAAEPGPAFAEPLPSLPVENAARIADGVYRGAQPDASSESAPS